MQLAKYCKFLFNHYTPFRNNTPSYIKILITHCQIISIISVINFKLIYATLDFTSFINFVKFFGAPQVLTSNQQQCLFNQDVMVDSYFQEIISYVVILVAYLLLILGVFALYVFYKKQLQLVSLILSVTVYYFLFLMPGSLNSLAAFLSVRNILDKQYMEKDLSVEVNSEEYNLSYSLIIPLLTGWLILVMFIFSILYRQRARIIKTTQSQLTIKQIFDNFSTKFYQKYRFLIMSYSKRAYYWEFVNIINKVLIIFIIHIYNQNMVIKTASIIVLLVIFSFIHLRIKPYESLLLNNLALYSQFIQIVTLSLLQIVLYVR